MKTILYNPIFINPQAYYVFPRLTRYLQPDNESTVEPANYIGTIEVKVIAYGDTTLKRTYSSTDYIDLSEFKNTWIRISLFTKVGSCVLGEWKIGDMQTDLPYIEPEVLASLKAVVVVGNKSNSDSDRAIVRNLVDKDNPFIISNTSYNLNSGYGKYNITFQYFPYRENIISISDNKVVFDKGGQLLLPYPSMDEDIPSFKIKVSGLSETYHFRYYYRTDDGVQQSINMAKDGYYELPIGYNVQSSSDGTNCGFANNGSDIVTIEQVPEFQGAFVTDGVNDLITSTKTVEEMLGGSNELTIVSMIHQVKDSANNVSFTNYIRGSANGYFRNIVNNYDKTGIYGYTSSDLMGLSVVNNILGDKNDYTSNGNNRDSIINGNFSVQGYSYNDGNNTGDFSSVAWYWTIIANKVLTTDQINQVIAYFNLDRTLNPDILCNTIKQGITNENHAEFGDKLIDFSGNGRDIQLNNIAWKGDSGIGKYNYIYNNRIKTYNQCPANGYATLINPTRQAVNGDLSFTISGSYKETVFAEIGEEAADGKFTFTNYRNGTFTHKMKDTTQYVWFRLHNISTDVNIGELTIEFIPSHAGALCLDGINDFGKVTGMPIYKDYTVVADREVISVSETGGILASKSETAAEGDAQGAFIFEYLAAPNAISTWSFYANNGAVATTDFTRSISYQSKYSYNGKTLTAGEAKDSDKLWIGIIRDRDSRLFNGAIYSLMSFPYSMSEFLIERQLKKHKLGTLYPDMVEFRPIVKSNVKWNIIEIWQGDKSLYRPAVNDDKTGIYLKKDSIIGIYVKPKDADEVTKIVVNGTEYTNLKINSNGFYYVTLPITKSPQKINITIDEYIRYEDIDFTNCYPGVPRIYVNDKSVTWGDKLKVGDEFTFYGNVNILPEMYNVLVKALYNGEEMVYGSIGTISKSMAFTSFKTYIFDDNEPKCILSPRLLSIPNSSYKILGYIPDISGHGNNGKINNSAYAEMSGANGYPYDYKSTSDFVAHASNAVLVNSEIVKFVNVLTQTSFYYKGTSYKGKIKVTGITKAIASGKVRYLDIYSNSTTNDERIIIDKDGTYDVNIETEDAVNIFFYLTPIVSGTTALDEPVYLEQVGNYEGAYCLDGVNDFVTIPTVNGGKQVFMKVNVMTTIDKILYDQRNSEEGGNFSDLFAIMTSNSDSILAYAGRNPDGKTYIDGILNTNITCGQLLNITHNITALVGDNKPLGKGGVIIGASKTPASYCKAAVYDFMLFDEISTDDKIQELNEYVGVEAKVEKPDYYWDAYGKTNFDEDKATIQQRGVAVGDYDLINYNHAYDKMSGYDGYEFAKFDNELDWYLTPDNGYIDVVSRNGYSITLKNLSTSDYGWYFQNSTVKEFITKDIPFKVKANKSIRVYWDMHSYKSNGENFGYVVNNITLNPNEDTSINLRHLTEEELTELDANKDRMYYLLWFDLSTLAVDEEVTIEMLPLYPNGLVYDGVEDFSVNKNIPIIDDFTVIAKRTWLEENISDKPFIIKGDTLYPDGNQNAFLFEYGKLSTYSFGQNNKYDESVVPSLISWATPTSYNGTTSLVKGSAIDTVGIDIAHATKMVFYKLILYPKTISLLEINFLKNLMEKDEIIDLTNPIFIQE